MQQRTRTPLRKPLAACTHVLSEEPPLAASISPPASDLAETKKEQVRSVGGGGGGGGGDAAGLFPGGTGCSAGCSAGEESGGGEHKSRQAVGGKNSHSKISSMVGGKSAALAQGQTTSSEGGAEVSASWMRMKDSEKMLKDLSTCKSRRMLLHLACAILGMGGLLVAAGAAEICRYGYVPSDEEVAAGAADPYLEPSLGCLRVRACPVRSASGIRSGGLGGWEYSRALGLEVRGRRASQSRACGAKTPRRAPSCPSRLVPCSPCSPCSRLKAAVEARSQAALTVKPKAQDERRCVAGCRPARAGAVLLQTIVLLSSGVLGALHPCLACARAVSRAPMSDRVCARWRLRWRWRRRVLRDAVRLPSLAGCLELGVEGSGCGGGEGDGAELG